MEERLELLTAFSRVDRLVEVEQFVEIAVVPEESLSTKTNIALLRPGVIEIAALSEVAAHVQVVARAVLGLLQPKDNDDLI